MLVDQNICGWNLGHYLHVSVSCLEIWSPRPLILSTWQTYYPGSVVGCSKKLTLESFSQTCPSLFPLCCPQSFGHMSILFVQLVCFSLPVSLVFWAVGLLEGRVVSLISVAQIPAAKWLISHDHRTKWDMAGTQNKEGSGDPHSQRGRVLRIPWTADDRGSCCSFAALNPTAS